MRIHSNVLTPLDLHSAALELPDVVVEIRYHGNGRKRSHVYDVTLTADAGKDYKGKKRRRKNGGNYGANDEYAATYDEHGVWMANLFDIDPDAIIVNYNGVTDFDQKTRFQFSDYVTFLISRVTQ